MATKWGCEETEFEKRLDFVLNQIEQQNSENFFTQINYTKPIDMLYPNNNNLVHALRFFDPDFAIHLINSGADVNGTYNDKIPLHYALKYKEVVKLLIDKGANVNVKDINHRTLFFHAVLTENLSDKDVIKDVIEILIKAGADINAKSRDGWTPLHSTASFLEGDITQILIDNGADINAKDDNGSTPIYEALLSINNLKILIDNKADVNIINYNNKTPLDLANIDGHQDIIKMLTDAGAKTFRKTSEKIRRIDLDRKDLG